MTFLTKLAAKILSHRARSKQRRTVKDTTNAMRAHLGLPGRL